MNLKSYVSRVEQQQTVFAIGGGGDDVTFKGKPVMARYLDLSTVAVVSSSSRFDCAGK